ncbi:MAG: hypothetical protein LBT66_02470 [Methanobrevibacter sp.]|jgi:V8-like Glu-specific endopeptidase|nr:hypothetical protein [Candidatus Methanovirga meridionalis]
MGTLTMTSTGHGNSICHNNNWINENFRNDELVGLSLFIVYPKTFITNEIRLYHRTKGKNFEVKDHLSVNDLNSE